MATGHRKTIQAMADRGLISEEERRQMVAGNCGHINPELWEWLMGYEAQFTDSLIPTPTSTDWKGGKKTRIWDWGGEYRHLLREFLECTPLGKIGLTNPAYLEWLMGYPIGWTE